MPDVDAEIDELLAALATAGVEFILIGGAAALIHGAPSAMRPLAQGQMRDVAFARLKGSCSV
jgi:hypothetical protein